MAESTESTLFNVRARRLGDIEWLLGSDHDEIAYADLTSVAHAGTFINHPEPGGRLPVIAWVNCEICNARHSWFLNEDNRIIHLPYGRSTFVTSALLPGYGVHVACRKHLAEFAEVKTKFAAMAWMEEIDVR